MPVTASKSGKGITADWMPKNDEDYYLISKKFYMLVATANSGTASELDGARYLLLNDIDMGYAGSFTGIHKCKVFDGGDYTICNLQIIDDGAGHCGMFPQTEPLQPPLSAT